LLIKELFSDQSHDKLRGFSGGDFFEIISVMDHLDGFALRLIKLGIKGQNW
jgi:hypothetical protein